MEPGYIRPRLRASLPFTLDHGIFSRIDIGVKIRYEKERERERKISWLQISKSSYYWESNQL